ncbi:hypothetical protein BGZ49_007403 [Haplosporangium sp. Z 27]|nr:hypothetical protein BGZ49_007403 [Haplosporangium sp. Z 27]
MTYYEPTPGTRGKRRAEECNRIEDTLIIENHLPEDVQAGGSYKKLANKRSKGKLNMMYTTPTTTSTTTTTANDHMSRPTQITPSCLSPLTPCSTSSSSPNYQVRSMILQPSSKKIHQQAPLCSSIIEGVKHSQLQALPGNATQEQGFIQSHRQANLGPSHHLYFLDTAQSPLNHTSHPPGIHHQYTHPTRANYNNEANEVYQQHMPLQDQGLQPYAAHMLRGQQHIHRVSQLPLPLDLSLIPMSQILGSQSSYTTEGIDDLGTLSDDGASSLQSHHQLLASTGPSSSNRRSRQRSRTLPSQDVLDTAMSEYHGSSPASIEQLSQDLSMSLACAYPLSTELNLHGDGGQVPAELNSRPRFNWVMGSGTENTLTVSQAPHETVSAPYQTNQGDNNISTWTSSRPASPPRHICSVCMKQFTRPFNLRSHMLAHENKKPFDCISLLGSEGCLAKFTRRHDLVRHIRAKHSSAYIVE